MSLKDFPRRVLSFWFLNKRWSDPQTPPNKSASIDPADPGRWFGSSKEFDQQIRDQFENDLDQLDTNDFQTAEDLLGCIIALDQFPRNIFRGTARAFAYDGKARELSRYLIDNQIDKKLPYVERMFVALPFEHSEDLDDQNRSVDYARQLYDEAKNDTDVESKTLDLLKGIITFAEKHRDIIQQFGRFPHRNQALNRPMTDKEDLYLTQGGNRFGQ